MDILVVDDDVVDRESIKRSLYNIGEQSSVIEADSVDKAITLCRDDIFDVVLLDYRMPQRDGVELLIELGKSGLDKNNVIIMMSNSEDEQLALDCIQAGAQDFLLKKDINASRLRRSILQATKRFSLEKQLRESFMRAKVLAERDSLTNLANRFLFEESFKMALANNKRSGTFLSLILFDIDDFKLINDNFGHGAGDQLLVQISNRISSCLRGNELFARLGGDEFAIVLANQSHIQNTSNVERRIHKCLSKAFNLDGHEINISISIGISICVGNRSAPEDMLKQADIAMYRSKKKGRGMTSFFENSMQEAVEYQLKIETGLSDALKKSQLTLVYQPVFKTGSHEVNGFEALIRWQSSFGEIAPDEFIPIAEESHKMLDIGRWVISEAIKQLSRWNEMTSKKLVMAINLSATQLADDDLPEFIEKQCKIYHVSPEVIEFELTETALINKPERKKAFLHKLCQLGSTIALDDFGTGYSSVSHLKHFPIHTVKLDRVVLPTDSDGEKESLLIKGMALMVKTLGLKTVVEGVETKEHEALCEALGVDLLQGYYYSKPLSVKDAEARYIKAQ